MVYQDFTTFTEQDDTNDHIQEPTATHVDAQLWRKGKACLYKDYLANHFGTTWEHKMDVKCVSVVTASNGGLFTVSDAVGSQAYLIANLKNAIGLVCYTLTSNVELLMVRSIYNGGLTDSNYYVITVGTTYYLRIKRDGTAVTCKIYDTAVNRDANGVTGLLATLSVTINASMPNHRYYMPCNENEYSTQDYYANWDIDNLDLQEVNNYTRTITDYLGGLDSKSRIATLHKIIIDLIGCLDTRSRIVSLHRTFTDKIGQLDSIIHTVIHCIYRTITESLDMLDTRSRIKTLYRTFTDKLAGLDTKSKIVSLHRVFTDKLGLKDTRSRIAAFHRIFIDKLGSLDTFIHEKQKQLFRVIVEFMGVKDSSSTVQSMHRVFTEFIGLKDKSFKLWNWFRKLFKYKSKEHPRQKVSKTGD